MIPAVKQDNAPNALKLLDFFYNPEHDEFVRFGLEGEQHEVKDGRKVILPPADNKPLALGMKNLTTAEDMNKRIEETYPEDQQQMVKDMFVVSTADARQIAGDGLPASVYEGFPDIQSHKLFQEVLTKIVIGELPLEAYDEYVKNGMPQEAKWSPAGPGMV